MAPLPDLPPYGVADIYKLLIYFGILYVLSTAITSWFITRRRSSPKQSKRPSREGSTQRQHRALGITETVSFDDTKDRLSSLKVEVQGAEAALEKLRELQENEQLSQSAYRKLSSQYNKRVNELSEQMNDMLQTDITSSSGQISEGITDDEIDELEADLEKQLMDLDKDDDFLKPRAKRSMDEIFEDDTETQPTHQPSSQSQPSQPTKQRSSIPSTPSASQPSPTPPQPGTSSQPQAASQPSVPQANPPVEKKKVPMPPPPNKPGSQSSSPQKTSVAAPPPPKKSSTPPPPNKASRQSSQPKANQPLSAAQPMKVEAEDDEDMFAKSTSIAALRMDMLRELARLKKLIPEDQEKDQ